MAESEEDIKRTLRQLKLANGVLTRFHWQQSEKLLAWCDRYGILLQEEIPLWQQPAEPGDEIIPVVQQQLAEMIVRHSHHPSIIAWGVGNELVLCTRSNSGFTFGLNAHGSSAFRTSVTLPSLT